MQGLPTPPPSLQHRVFNGVAWSLLQTIGSRALSMAIIVVLARVLGPAEFGIVTMAFIVWAAMVSIVDLAMGDVLVRRFPQDAVDYDTAFWGVTAFSVVLAALLACASVPLSAALAEPRLPPLLWILAAMLPLSALELIQAARMRAEMQFRPLAVRTLIATAAGGAAGIALALAGAGYWSLLAKGVVESLVSVALVWRHCSWRPGRRFSRRRWSELFEPARHLMGGRLLDLVIQRFDAFLVSARLGAAPLAMYVASHRVYGAFMDTLFSTVNRVTMPAFGRMGEDHARIAAALLRVVRFTAFFTFPAFAAIAVLAEPIVVTLLGAPWRPAAPILAAFAAGGVLYSVSHFNPPVLAATNRTALLLRYMLCDAALVVILLSLGSRWGTVGVAVAYAARVTVLLPLSLRLLHRAIGLEPARWIGAVAPAALATVASAALLVTLQRHAMPSAPVPLQLLTFATVYVPLHAAVALALAPGACMGVLDEVSRVLPRLVPRWMPRLRTACEVVRRCHVLLRLAPRNAG